MKIIICEASDINNKCMEDWKKKLSTIIAGYEELDVFNGDIGKFQKPHCFKNMDISQVIWKCNKKSWSNGCTILM